MTVEGSSVTVVPAQRAPRRPLPRRAARWVLPTWLLRFGTAPFFVGGDVAVLAGAALLVGGSVVGRLLSVLVTVALLWSGGLYRSRLRLSALDDLPRLIGRVLAGGGIIAAALLLFGEQTLAGDRVRSALLAAVALPVLRAGAYRVVVRVRAARRVYHPTVVLGAGRVGARIVQDLLVRPGYGLTPVGFVDSTPLLPPDKLPVPVLGSSAELARVLRDHEVTDVIVAFSAEPSSDLVSLLRTCDRMDCEIFLVPRLFEAHHRSVDMDEIWGIPLVRLRRAAYRSMGWRVKRLLDVVVSALALLLVAPLLAVLALLVRLETGPGVLFRQERVGLDGRPFSLIKLRSLKPAAPGESETMWNVADDPRLGPVGRVLRRTSLDELPQLWNVLRGDMSLVGPRPERPHFVAQFGSELLRYTDRHRVPAGLTGWAQVHGLRGDTSIEERARFDNQYIENWSLWLDVKIVVRTLAAVVRREGG